MDAQQFLAVFGHVANATRGLARMRELVLHLAVSGDLIQSDAPADATSLLDTIALRKRQHLDQKRVVGKQASLSRSAIRVPPHWAVCRLGDLTLTITGGGTPSKNEGGYWGGDIPWASVKDLKDFKFLDDTEDHITQEGLAKSTSNLIPPGRVIVCTRMGLGKVAINRIAMAINQDLKALELPPEVNPDFFLILYKTRELKGKGTTVSGIKQNQLLALPAALPPANEQARIVAKVDELMALCDKLEEQQADRRKLQGTVRQSIVHAVAAAPNPHELEVAWTRLSDHFGHLFSAPEDVAAFKGLVLDLAVSGSLLPSKPHESLSGVALLEAIASKRLEWSKNAEEQEQKEAAAMIRKLRTQRAVLPPEPIPEHWSWGSLLQVSQAVVDCHNKTAPYVANGIHLVRTTDIRDGRMLLSNTKKISEETYAYWARRMPPKAGDIFFTREAPMGEAAIVPEGDKVCLGQRTMLIRLFPDLFSNRFLLYVLLSPSFQSRMIGAAIGMTVKHLRVGDVENLMVPVPPRLEQDQIVNLVDRLLEVSDHYAGELQRKQRIATDFAGVAVSTLTGIGSQQGGEVPMKVPQTELIAQVRLCKAPDTSAQAPLATILARHQGELSARDLWQRYGGEIDAFYSQLKTEVAHGWIAEPEVAEMREQPADAAGA
jgi:type I restriction enzyme, S subunit